MEFLRCAQVDVLHSISRCKISKKATVKISVPGNAHISSGMAQAVCQGIAPQRPGKAGIATQYNVVRPLHFHHGPVQGEHSGHQARSHGYRRLETGA